MKKLALHWRILIGMAVGVVFGLIAVQLNAVDFVNTWIKPFGRIFINLLKLIAVPLILASLIKGVSDLQDISQLSKMGFRTIGMYLVTTITAITIGLVLVNLIRPGAAISEENRAGLLAQYETAAGEKIQMAADQKSTGPLQFIEDMVPENIIGSASSNGNMLQVIFFALFFGIALILVAPHKSKPVKDFFDGLNETVLVMIDLIMRGAPYGVFALMAGLIVDAPNADIFVALGKYAITVVLGLALMVGVYSLIVKYLAGRNPGFFLKGISPAQLLAFSTSSSAATLPVTMECVEQNLGVEEEVASFVLPIGATVNMDGTSLYQAVAAVFIAQVFGMHLTLGDQLTIVLTATLASIGSAAVPSAGMVMLVIVLEAINVPAAGLALIFAVDRPLDMCRTVVNVSGDAAVSMVVANSIGKLGKPHVHGIE